jgi:hypothetical protein
MIINEQQLLWPLQMARYGVLPGGDAPPSDTCTSRSERSDRNRQLVARVERDFQDRTGGSEVRLGPRCMPAIGFHELNGDEVLADDIALGRNEFLPEWSRGWRRHRGAAKPKRCTRRGLGSRPFEVDGSRCRGHRAIQVAVVQRASGQVSDT